MLIGGDDICYEVITTFFSMFVYSRAVWRKFDSSADREPQGIGGGIQIPET